MAIKFEENSIEVINELRNAVERALLEVASEIKSQTQRNTPVSTGQLKGSWRYILEQNGDTQRAYVGSELENAIWNELGTGEHAIKKDGKPGGWWIKVGNGHNEISPKEANKYSWDDYRYKDGKLAYVFTFGKPPQRSLQRAFQKNKKWAIDRIQEEISKIGED